MKRGFLKVKSLIKTPPASLVVNSPTAIKGLKRVLDKAVFASSDDLVVSTLSPQSNLDHSVQCILRKKMENAIFSISGFPTSLPIASNYNYTHDPQSPNGRGSITASCDLELGDLIFSECPLLIVPPFVLNIGPTDPSVMKKWAQEKEAQERLLTRCIERMSPENRAAYLNLPGDPNTKNSATPMSDIARMHGFTITLEADGEADTYGGIFERAARLRHQLVPTPYLRIVFELTTFSNIVVLQT
ncbi:hypothetical protein H0H87_012014 [Tephrocybe sp. NHM501043]|nr:hypothetical protein H0H87_012014 [Tephrocybe sp. NHM501043]